MSEVPAKLNYWRTYAGRAITRVRKYGSTEVRKYGSTEYPPQKETPA